MAKPSDDSAVILSVLTLLLPPDTEIYLFGSRQSGQAQRSSDWDVLLRAPTALPYPLLARLEEALEDSDLEPKIDLVDYHRVSEGFRRRVLPSATKIWPTS